MPKSAAVLLTDAYIRALAPSPTGRLTVSDADTKGLRLRIEPSGRKTWWLFSRVKGAPKGAPATWHRLGEYPALTLKAARDQAATERVTARAGNDPAVVERERRAGERKRRAEEEARVTVADLAPRWLAAHTAEPSTLDGYRLALENHVMPALGALKAADVERKHVAALHTKMKNTPSAANRVLAVVSLLMQHAETDGARPPHSNPVFGIKRYKETKRQRFLTHDELSRIGAVLMRAEREGLPPSPAMQAKKSGMSKVRRAKVGTRPKRGPYAATTAGKGDKGAKEAKPIIADRYSVAALRLMLLTGWRMAEVVGTRWADVDLKARVVRHRTTKGGATARPLSAPAADLLDELPRLEQSPWVFPRAADKKKPAGKPRRLWDAVRHAAGLDSDDKQERVMPHDLRHSVGAVAASSGASLPVIAALLGHKQVSTTERYSHLHRDARHDAADATGNIIAELLSRGAETVLGADVIPIDKRRRRRA